MKIHLIHGIHSGGLNDQAHRLLPYLERIGLPVVFPDYGYILGIESKRINPIVVGSILPYIEPGDVMVGHSNGCAIIARLAALGAPMAGAVLVNAALASHMAADLGKAMHFPGHAKTAIPSVQGRKITVGLEMRTLAVAAFEKLPQLGIPLHHMAIGIDDRIVDFHNCAPFQSFKTFKPFKSIRTKAALNPENIFC